MIEEDVKNATNNGLLVGVYHLAYPSTNTAESEAQHFVNVSKNYLQQGYLQPMLDIEQGECDKFADKSVLVQWIKDWMNSVRQKGGNDNIKPILYTGCCCADAMKSKDPAFINELLNEGRLWIARYPDSEEHNPSDNPPASYLSNPCKNVCNFDASKWGFWQWTDKMKVDGIPSNYVDEDIFNGNLSKLQTFIIPSVEEHVIIRLTTNTSNDIQPTWSPNGESIAFISDRINKEDGYDLFAINPDGTNERVIAQFTVTDPWHGRFAQPSWIGNSGDLLVMDHKYYWEIMRFNFSQVTELPVYRSQWDGDSAYLKRLLFVPGGQGASWPVTPKDGSKIAWSALVNSWTIPREQYVYEVRCFEGDLTKFIGDTDKAGRLLFRTEKGGGLGAVSFSPDGSKLVITACKEGWVEGKRMDLYVIDVETGETRRITTTGEYGVDHDYVSWSSKDVIAFASRVNDTSLWDLYTIHPDGSNLTQLTSTPWNEIHPSWSPDGSKLAFSSDKEGNYDIYVLNYSIAPVLSYKIYDDPDVDWEVMNITTPKGVESGDTIDIYKSRELIAKFDAGMKNICIYNKSEKYWANLEAHYREMYNGPSHYPVQSNPTIKTKGETLILSVNSSTDDDKIKAHYSFTIYPNGSIYINKTASVPNPVATDECLREDGNIGIHFGEFKADGKSYVKIYDNGTLFSWNLTNPSGFGDVDTSHTLENGDWISKTESGSNVTLIFRVDYTSGYDNEGKPSSLAAVVQYTPAHMGLMIGRKGVMMWHPTVLPAGEYITRGWISVEPTSVNNPPDPPLNLAQLKSDGTTEISVGGMTDERTVIIKGNVSDPDGDKIKLQVELRRLDEYDGTFLQRFTQESNLGSNGSQVGIPVYGLIDGDYHWQARTVDEYGLTSEWVDFGNNDISDADFTVSSPNQHPTASFTYSPQSPKAGEEVILDASNSYDPDGKIKLYEWDLDGDNEYEGFTTSSEIYYYWDKSGTYSVKLRVTDINGATNTIIQDINIEQNSWWDKLKKFFAPSVIRLSKSEKQRFEVIKRELHISNRNSSF